MLNLKRTAHVAVFLCLSFLVACTTSKPVDFTTGKEVRGPSAYYECKQAGHCK